SPRTIGMQSRAVCGSASDFTVISGPMPAASPMVIAMRGRNVMYSLRYGDRDESRTLAPQHAPIDAFDPVENLLPRCRVFYRGASRRAQTSAGVGVAQQVDDRTGERLRVAVGDDATGEPVAQPLGRTGGGDDGLPRRHVVEELHREATPLRPG